MTTHVFKLELRVTDPARLYLRALAHLTQADGLTLDEALEIIGPREDHDTPACIVALLDPGSLPGAEILHSQAEAFSL